MQRQTYQLTFQNTESYSEDAIEHLRKNYQLTDLELENAEKLGLSERDLFLAIVPLVEKVVIDREMLSSYEDALAKLRQVDRENIDQNESKVLGIANELGLFDKEKASQLEQKALNNELDEPTTTLIKILQAALKEDGKYDDIIDGIPGVNTRNGISALITENITALVESSDQLHWNGIKDQLELPATKGFERF